MNSEDIILFMSKLYGEDDPSVNYCAYEEKDGFSFHAVTKYQPIKKLLPLIQKTEDARAGSFFMPNRSGTKSTKAEDVKTCHAIWIDIDCTLPPEKWPLPPSAEASRGQKRHVYWFIETTEDKSAWFAVHELAKDFFFADQKQTGAQSRIRIPGTYNHKRKEKDFFGLEYVNDNRYTLSQLQEVFALPAHIRNARRKISAVHTKDYKEPLVDGSGRDEFMLFAALCFNEFGATEEEEFEQLKIVNKIFLAEPYEEEHLKKYIRKRKEHITPYADVPPEEIDNAKRKDGVERLKAFCSDWRYVTTQDKYVNLADLDEKITSSAMGNILSQIYSMPKCLSYCHAAKFILHVSDIRFAPGREKEYMFDNKVYLNYWEPSNIEPVEGDVSWYLDHAKYIISDETERTHLLKWLAFCIQRPGEKIRHAPLIISTIQQNGKSILIYFAAQLVGKPRAFHGVAEKVAVHNFFEIENEHAAEKHNGFLNRTTLLYIPEICTSDNRKDFASRFKQWTTAETTSSREMQKDLRMEANYFNVIATSNKLRAVHIENNDERWFVIRTDAPKKSKEYYNELARKLKDKEALSHLMYFFKNMDLSDFNATTAPATKAKEELKPLCRSDNETLLDEWFNDHPDIELISLGAIMRMLQQHSKFVTLSVVQTLILDSPYNGVSRGKPVYVGCNVENGKQINWRPWIVRNHAKWTELSDEEFITKAKQEYVMKSKIPEEEHLFINGKKAEVLDAIVTNNNQNDELSGEKKPSIS